MNPFALLAPLFFAFEVWQLVVGEKYLGVKQIKAGADPRTLPMSHRIAVTWSLGLLAYWLWMVTLLFHPIGRAQGIVLIAVSVIGFACRAASNLKWTLVTLTLEGSIRIGMLISLFGSSLRRLLA